MGRRLAAGMCSRLLRRLSSGVRGWETGRLCRRLGRRLFCWFGAGSSARLSTRCAVRLA